MIIFIKNKKQLGFIKVFFQSESICPEYNQQKSLFRVFRLDIYFLLKMKQIV
jgi:hypothetical protein